MPLARPTETTTYVLTAVSDSGCVATDEIVVRVVSDLRVFTANVFSPASSYPNDRLVIFASPQVREVLDFQVFTRWGDLVFSKKNFAPGDSAGGWDGKLNGKILDAGVYVFYARLGLLNGKTVLEKGEVTLLR